jgi:purine-binding chemotaxis protein CheW
MNFEKEHNISDDIIQLVTFKIDNEEFGIDILKVEEIIKLVSITKIPNSPEFVEGVIDLRGKLIPIIDLRVRLKRNKKNFDNNTRVIVVEVSGMIVGFIVDSVKEVIRIPNKIIEPPPSLVIDGSADYITAIGKLEDRLLILLDLEKVLDKQQKTELSQFNLE